MYLAYKLAQLALLPGVWILVSLCVIALLLRSPARSVAARRLAIATALGFLALSSRPLPALLVRALERRFPPIAPATAAEAPRDAIVVLTGGAHWEPGTHAPTVLRSPSLDRLVEAAILWRAGAAPRIILTGGIGDPLGGTPPEATTMADLARSLGLPADALETETASRTTAESAHNVRALHPDLRAIYLVSAAIHLPRGVALFRKQAFDVAPVPAGYLENDDGWTPQALLPGYEGLEDSTAAIHELAGLLAGRVTGAL